MARLLQFVRRNPKSDYFLLGCLVVVCILVTQWWLSQEARPPHWDFALNLEYSLGYLDSFKDFDVVHLFSYHYYPPLLYWKTIPFYLIFGESLSSAVLVASIFMGLLAFSVYAIGKELWNRSTGILGAVFVLTLPLVITQFRQYQPDGPMAALVAFTLLCLIKSKEFSYRRWSLLLGAAVGAGMMMKWTYALAALLPVGYALVIAFRRDWRKRLPNVAKAVFVAAIIAGPWYLAHGDSLLRDLTTNAIDAGVREGDPAVFSLAGVTYYAKNLLDVQLYLFPLLLLLVGVAVSFWKRNYLQRNIYPLLLVAGVYISFTLLTNKDARYTLPFIGGVAVLATYWVTLLGKRSRAVLTGLLVTYGLVTYAAITFGTGWLPHEVRILGSGKGHTLWAQHGYIYGPPSSEEWHLESVFKKISEDSPGVPKTAFYEGSDTAGVWISPPGVAYYAKRYSVTLVSPHGTSHTNDRQSASYVITRSAAPSSGEPGLVVLQTWQLPDGSYFTLSRRVGL